MVTKNEVDQKDSNSIGWVLVWDCGDRWVGIFNLNRQLLCKKHNSFSSLHQHN
jgi:hypothetical protein